MLPESIAQIREDKPKSIEDAQHLLGTKYRTRYAQVSLEHLDLYSDGHVGFRHESTSERLAFSQHFLESVARTINLPLHYGYRDNFSLFNKNFEHRKQKCTSGFTLAICNEKVVGIAPVDYRPARSVDILEILKQASEKLWNVQNILLSDVGVDVNLTIPNLTIEPDVGDVIKIGISVTNSEVGQRGAKASLYSYRLVCSNGTVFPDCKGVARWNYDRRMHQKTSHAKISEKLETLVKQAESEVAPLYEHVLDAKLFDSYFVKLWRRLTYVMPQTAVISNIFHIDDADRRKIQTQVRTRTEGPPAPTHLGVYDTYNNITDYAKERPFLARRRLEEIGGQLLYDVSRN